MPEEIKTVVGSKDDVSPETVKLRNAVRELKKFQLAVEYASDQITITDVNGIVIYVNAACEKISGYSPPELIGLEAYGVWGEFMGKKEFDKMWRKIRDEKKPFIGETTQRKKDGTKYITNTRISPIIGDKGDVIFFVIIEDDVTKAKEIDRMKTEFISIASHQLRTPLSAMKWYLEMLLDGTFGEMSREQIDYIKRVNESNERMIELVNALLNVSRIESGRIMIRPEPVHMYEILRGVLEELQVKINIRKLKVDINYQDGIPQVNLDQKLIRNVLLNLISNSIKYTMPEGHLEISVYRENDDLVTKISDTGMGISEADQGKVFQKFFRADNVKKMETDGTGLGLYLVKAIIDSSRGKIWFTSKEGEGTTFWFSLPMRGMPEKDGKLSLEE